MFTRTQQAFHISCLVRSVSRGRATSSTVTVLGQRQWQSVFFNFIVVTGCDSNSSFYGKGKKSVFDQVAKSPVAQQQLLWCGDDLHLKEEVEVKLFGFVRNVIYSDSKSNTMAEGRAAKWKT